MKANKRMDLVVVYTSAGALGAEVVKGRLESAGIHAILQSESQSVFPMTIDGMGQVKVLVAKEHEQEARALLEQNEQS